jgi:hypothetical protein
MSRKYFAQVLLLLSFTAQPQTAFADVITGVSPLVSAAVSSTDDSTTEPESDQRTRATSPQTNAQTLFDESGASLLYITPAQYLYLFEPRGKLRSGGGLGTGGGDNGGAGGGGDLIPAGATDAGGLGAPAIGNVGAILGDGTPIAASGPLTAIPEPSALLLMASALAFGTRRWIRKHRVTPD